MSCSALIGLQWGDEGKGKVVDAISPDVSIVVRSQGGANAGHTVKVGDTSRVLHLVPSGMLYDHVTGVVGNGVVLDPFTLLKELDGLKESGHDIFGRLLISDRAHLVLPWHKEMDEALERFRGGGAIGTTKRGIGPAYQDKAARSGIRAGELRDLPALKERVLKELEAKQRIFKALEIKDFDGEALIRDLEAAAVRLAPLVADTVSYVNDAADRGEKMLIEGAQGSLLDLDLGTYPYVTSSNCHLGGLLAGCGLAPQRIKKVTGVAKAYCTRVGGGPFPTEDTSDQGQRMRDRGHEYGSTTGRPRRCGWMDLVALRYAVRTNGVTDIALTKADVLSGAPELRFATHYEIDGELVKDFPAGDLLDRAQPKWNSLPGFDEDLTGVREFGALPTQLKEFVELVEETVGVPVSIVSVGPDRSQTIRR